MNTNPNAIKILCYGDSNTFAAFPGIKGKRYPADVRWTGVLQGKLGDDYEIVEEGLNSRTINLDDLRPGKLGKNGMIYLIPCLDTHKPIDIVLVMLGSNDLKNGYHRSIPEISSSLEEMIKLILSYGLNKDDNPPKIIVVSPILMNDSVDYPAIKEHYLGATERSRQLAPEYEKIAKKYDCLFLDAAKIADPDQADGMHLNDQGHKALADELFELITTLCHPRGPKGSLRLLTRGSRR